eukprot:479150_1
MSNVLDQPVQIIDSLLESLSTPFNIQSTQHMKQSMQYDIRMLCNWMKSQIDEYEAHMNESLDSICTQSHSKLRLKETIKAVTTSFIECLKSGEYKGNNMTITDDKQTVQLQSRFKKSIRMESGICNGMKVRIKYELYCARVTGNFIGVTSARSKRVHYNKRAMDHDGGILDCYGIDTCCNRIYLGDAHRFVETDWQNPKPEITFEDDKTRAITMIVDRTQDTNDVLLFYMDSEEECSDTAGYRIQLPSDNDVWYPAISLSRPNSWCKIVQTPSYDNSLYIL